MKLLSSYRPGSNRLLADLTGKFSHKPPHLFLLRHGQILGPGPRRFVGQTDLPLDTTGRAQASSWEIPLASISFGQVYSSGLGRCRETAALACPGQEALVDERLNEINLGTWENLSFDEIRTTRPDLFDQRGRNIYEFRPPGGESFQDLFARASAFFDQLPLDAPTLVVTHAGVIRVMCCHWAGREMDELLSFDTAYGQLFVLADPKSAP